MGDKESCFITGKIVRFMGEHRVGWKLVFVYTPMFNGKPDWFVCTITETVGRLFDVDPEKWQRGMRRLLKDTEDFLEKVGGLPSS